MRFARNPNPLAFAGVAAFTLLQVLVTSGSDFRPGEAHRAQNLEGLTVAFNGYTHAASGWQTTFLTTNTSSQKLECFAYSYAAGLSDEGSTGTIATNSEATFLPREPVWTQRQPEKFFDPGLMKRYGIKGVFELEPGERFALQLPVKTLPSHPHDFVSHLVLNFRPISKREAQKKYETYVAEVNGVLKSANPSLTNQMQRTRQ
jgi:hypothetical protein